MAPHIPLEILAAIIDPIQVEQDAKTLAVCCLVNRTFNAVSTPHLYRSIHVIIRMGTKPDVSRIVATSVLVFMSG